MKAALLAATCLAFSLAASPAFAGHGGGFMFAHGPGGARGFHGHEHGGFGGHRRQGDLGLALSGTLPYSGPDAAAAPAPAEIAEPYPVPVPVPVCAAPTRPPRQAGPRVIYVAEALARTPPGTGPLIIYGSSPY